MRLLKKTTTAVDGFEGDEHDMISFMLSEEVLENEKPVEQADVVEADVVFLEYNTYEDMGEITEEEIFTLKKFGIL
jgi:hypothetical protein